MVKKKQVEGKEQPKNLWDIDVPTITMKQFAKETANTEKTLWFGESNSGKTRGYLDILAYYKAKGIPKEKVMMCIITPDRSTGITKLYNLIPEEYVDRVFPYTINCYEDMVSATATAEKKLMEHYKQTGTHGWMIIELLESAWQYTQDYYARMSYGETLADLMALNREKVQEMMKEKEKEGKETAYMVLEGRRDWVTIKFFHNFNWIDKIKKMPFNIGATAEVKEETNKDSIFYEIKIRPSGEKSNVHRFDTIIYKSHRGNKFYQQCFKWTGMSRLYNEIDITDKNSWSVHKKIQKQFEDKGYRSSAIEELEEEAGIILPKEEPKESIPDNITLEPEEPKQTELPKEEPETKPPEQPKETPPEKPPEEPKEEKPTQPTTPEPTKPEPAKEKKKEKPKKESPDDFDWNVSDL